MLNCIKIIVVIETREISESLITTEKEVQMSWFMKISLIIFFYRISRHIIYIFLLQNIRREVSVMSKRKFLDVLISVITAILVVTDKVVDKNNEIE